jgi:hypothetical protein
MKSGGEVGDDRDAGLGGSWAIVFARIAAVGHCVLAASVVVLGLAWIVAYRRGVLRRLAWRLGAATALPADAVRHRLLRLTARGGDANPVRRSRRCISR